MNTLSREEELETTGVDISLWQNLPVSDPDRREIDFDTMRLNANFAVFRAGQNNWQDREFQNYRKQARAVGLPHGSYWFYDSRAEPKKQADLWLSIVDDDYGELGLWCDFEDNYGGKWRRWQDWQDFILRLSAADKDIKIGVYTGYYYWMEHTAGMSYSMAEWWSNFPLWIANYKVDKPLLPKPWSDWTLWQYTDKGDAGKYGIYDSKNVDLNYFNGTLEKFHKMFNIDGVLPIDRSNKEQTMKYRMTTISNDTRIRTLSSTLGRVLANVPANVVVSGDELFTATQKTPYQDIGDKWLRIDYKGIVGWMAYIHKGTPICKDFSTEGTPNPTPASTPSINADVQIDIENGTVTSVSVDGVLWKKQ